MSTRLLQTSWVLVGQAMRLKQRQPGVAKRHAPAEVPGFQDPKGTCLLGL